MKTDTTGRRYMDTDWEFNWEGLPDRIHRYGRRGNFFQIVHHPMEPHEDRGGCTWGNSGVHDHEGVSYGIGGCDDERQRREAIACKCWDIIDNEPGITINMVQQELRKIDLELVRTARPTRRRDETGEEDPGDVSWEGVPERHRETLTKP